MHWYLTFRIIAQNVDKSRKCSSCLHSVQTVQYDWFIYTHLQYSFTHTSSTRSFVPNLVPFYSPLASSTTLTGKYVQRTTPTLLLPFSQIRHEKLKLFLNEYVIKHIALTFKTAQRLFTQRDLPTGLQSDINSRSRFINWYRLGTVTVITVLTDFFRAHNRRNSTLLFRMINEVFRFD